MNTISVSKRLLNSMVLPGMGRSVELSKLSGEDNLALRQAYNNKSLQIEFVEEPGVYHTVINLWPDPHSMERMTLFIE